jgi:hypothetical protein
LIDIIDFVVTVHFSGDPFMTFSAVWHHLFHDVILTTLWRFLPFLFNFKECATYVSDFKLCNIIIIYLRNLFIRK